MAKSQESVNKKEKEAKRFKKQKEKQQKSDERKKNSQGGGLDNMMAYVDENGMLTSTPQDPTKKKVMVDVSTIKIGVSKREEEDVPAIRNGRVDFYNDSKGFGFIKEIGTQEKYFVNVKGLLDEIKEGDLVTFELERGIKGLNAFNVKKV